MRRACTVQHALRAGRKRPPPYARARLGFLAQHRGCRRAMPRPRLSVHQVRAWAKSINAHRPMARARGRSDPRGPRRNLDGRGSALKEGRRGLRALIARSIAKEEIGRKPDLPDYLVMHPPFAISLRREIGWVRSVGNPVPRSGFHERPAIRSTRKPGERRPSGLGARVHRLVEQLEPKTA